MSSVPFRVKPSLSGDPFFATFFADNGSHAFHDVILRELIRQKDGPGKMTPKRADEIARICEQGYIFLRRKMWNTFMGVYDYLDNPDNFANKTYKVADLGKGWGVDPGREAWPALKLFWNAIRMGASKHIVEGFLKVGILRAGVAFLPAMVDAMAAVAHHFNIPISEIPLAITQVILGLLAVESGAVITVAMITAVTPFGWVLVIMAGISMFLAGYKLGDTCIKPLLEMLLRDLPGGPPVPKYQAGGADIRMLRDATLAL